VHRLLARRRGSFIFKGDGSPRTDPPVVQAALIGRVVEVQRGTQTTPLGARDRLVQGVPRCLMFQAKRTYWAVRTARKRMIGRNAIDDSGLGD